MKRLSPIWPFHNHTNVIKFSGPLCLWLASALTLLVSHAALAAGTATLQHQGVEAYGAGSYDQALDLFSQAVANKPEDATALFNQGTALYRLGRFSEASQSFAASAGLDKNLKSRARAAYNQGRALLAAAGASQEPAQKKELLLAGNQAFQQALRADPGLKAARKGIADFRAAYAKVKEQENQAKQRQQQPGDKGQKQEQQDQTGQGQQDLEKKLTEAGQQQQDMANQSKEASAGKGQEGASPEQLQDKAAQQQSVRQSLEKIKEELSKDQEGGPDSKELAKELEQAISAQKKAEEALKQGDLKQAQQHQQKAADSLQELAADQKEQAAQAARADAGEEKQDDQAAQASAAGQQQENDQGREAEKTDSTVADILDGEKALHEMRRLRMKQQRPASGKDW